MPGNFSAVAGFSGLPSDGEPKAALKERKLRGTVLWTDYDKKPTLELLIISRSQRRHSEPCAMTKNPQFPSISVGASAGGIEALKDSSKACLLTRGWHRGVTESESRARERSRTKIIARYTLTVRVGRQTAPGPAELCTSSRDAVLRDFQGALQVSKPTLQIASANPSISLSARWRKDQGEVRGRLSFGMDGDGTLADKARRERGGLKDGQTPNGHGPRPSRTCPIAPLRRALSTSNPGR